jgi:hypothetical protein
MSDVFFVDVGNAGAEGSPLIVQSFCSLFALFLILNF